MRSADEILHLICSFLNTEKIDYVIVGGLAVLFHGIPRTTMDIDVILEDKKLEEFVAFLKENDFFANLEDIKIAFKEKSHATIQDKLSMIRLDIKGIYNDSDKQTLDRKTNLKHRDITVNIASAEDTIANKLLFGSDQDIKDAMGIYIRQLDNLDMDYLTKTCKQLKIYNDFLEMKKRVGKYLEL